MMITVNLRPGQKRKAAGGGTRKLLEPFRALGSKVKDPLLMGAAAACIGVALWLGVSFIAASTKFNSLGPKLEAARDEQKRFDNLLRQKRRAEAIRDSLLAQITTIRGVDGDRYIWPHVLDEVAKALPPYTWLVTMAPETPAPVADTVVNAAPPPLRFRVEGRTMDIQAYTRFLRQLEASPWFEEVRPVEAKTVLEKERPVTAFVVSAQYQPADSAYIRTVPLSQSVR